MIKLNTISIFVTLILLFNFKPSSSFDCYSCSEADDAKCGEYLLNPMPSITTCESDKACVTFKNKYIGGSMKEKTFKKEWILNYDSLPVEIVRGCIEKFFVPPLSNGQYSSSYHNIENCLKDKYSLGIFLHFLINLKIIENNFNFFWIKNCFASVKVIPVMPITLGLCLFLVRCHH